MSNREDIALSRRSINVRICGGQRNFFALHSPIFPFPMYLLPPPPTPPPTPLGYLSQSLENSLSLF